MEVFLLAVGLGAMAANVAVGLFELWEDPTADKVMIVVGLLALLLYWSK